MGTGISPSPPSSACTSQPATLLVAVAWCHLLLVEEASLAEVPQYLAPEAIHLPHHVEDPLGGPLEGDHKGPPLPLLPTVRWMVTWRWKDWI